MAAPSSADSAMQAGMLNRWDILTQGKRRHKILRTEQTNAVCFIGVKAIDGAASS